MCYASAEPRNPAPKTKRVALKALIFLYREFLETPLEGLNYEAARKPAKLPTVFSPEEAKAAINNLSGEYRLIAMLIYGSGLRINEVLRLRVKDVDFGMQQLVVRSDKGNKDRITLLPDSLLQPLTRQIEAALHQHSSDWATQTSAPRKSTPTSSAKAVLGCAVPWTMPSSFPGGYVELLHPLVGCIGACRHDVIVFVQPPNLVGPPAYSHLAVFQQNGGVMPLGFGQVAHLVGECLGLSEVLEFEHSLQLLFSIQFNNLPLWHVFSQSLLLVRSNLGCIRAASFAVLFR